MPVMNMIQALNSAMDVMLARNPDVVIFGEDVGYFGGVFRATEGLQKKYGLNRIFDAPITSIRRPTNLSQKPRAFATVRAVNLPRR
jgi:pyruvate/2-oxoglutarate/acetoin dehydrogenase E1 component